MKEIEVMSKKAYSLWTFEHESFCFVSATKVKDTNSWKEVVDWVSNPEHGATYYIDREYMNAEHLQLIEIE
jgi:hypothetical protein